MTRSDIEEILGRRPFVPLKIRLVDGSVLDVPFSHVAIPFSRSLIVLKGVKKEGSHVATGKDEIAYDRIATMEPRKTHTGRRKRAS